MRTAIVRRSGNNPWAFTALKALGWTVLSIDPVSDSYLMKEPEQQPELRRDALEAFRCLETYIERKPT